MTEVAEEAMDSSAVSEEEVEDQQETSQEEKSSPNKSSSKISAAGEIIEGKRTKKTVERLDFQAPKQKEKLRIGDGSGDKLGDIPRTGYQITKMKPADLKPLHAILFDRPGKMATLKKNLRLFNGFPFDANSEQYTKKREKLLKNSNFTNTKLKVVCGVLDLEKKGTHSDLVDRILTFLIAPKNSGKRLPVKKKRKSKKKLSGDDSNAKTKKKSKPKPRSLSSSPKKSKTGSKSKAIVMDSSSDEDDDEEDEKAAASAEAEGTDTEDKQSEKEEDQSDKLEGSAEEEEEEEDDDDDDESPKSKSGRGKSAPKKSAPVKRQRTPAKKTGPPKKRAKKDVSEESESDADSEADEKPKKKKSAPAKPAAKTKKADSSSNSKNNTNTAEDSSDDDEPLIKMIKKAPTDEQLKQTVQSLLKEANLEEMTMKQICQRVFDTYPDHDLTSKKDYIKQTVKSRRKKAKPREPDKPKQKQESASSAVGFMSAESDNSKEYPPLFSSEPKASQTSGQYTSGIQQNQDTLRVFESKAMAFVKKALKTHQKVLSAKHQGLFVEDEQDVAHDDEQVESDDETKEAALKIALHILRTMNEDEHVRTLQQSHYGAVAMYQKKLRSSLKKKNQYILEDITKQSWPVPLEKIYTKLYLIEGDSGQVNNEHEVRQIERAFNKMELQKSETVIECRDIFKPLPKRSKQIRTVLTKGIAGIGKTVLAQKFILDWELNLLQNEKRSLMELLYDFSPGLKESEIKELETSKVLFVLDGLDECRLPLDFERNERCCDATQSASVDVLLTNLIAEMCAEAQGGKMPKTLTQMYIHFVAHQTKQSHVKYGKEHQLDCRGNERGVCTQVFREESCMQKKVFCFVHLSVQEFLAALYVHVMYKVKGVNLMVENRMVKTKSVSELHKAAVDRALKCDNGQLDLFLRFLLGLSLDSSQSLLKSMKIVVDTCDSQSLEETIEYIKGKISPKLGTEKFVNLFHCLNELNDHSLVEEIQSRLDSDRDVMMDGCSAAQWATLGFVLLTSTEKLNDCNLTANCCEKLASALSSSSNELNHLNLSDNNLQDSGIDLLCSVSGLQSPHCRLKTLRLNRCGLTQKCCVNLASVLSCPSSHLRELDLSDNDIADLGLQQLSNGLGNTCCKLETLRLSFCNITEEGCGYLAMAVTSNPSHLSELDLSYNHLGESGVKLISKALEEGRCELTRLRVDHNAQHWFKSGLRESIRDVKLFDFFLPPDAREVELDPNTAHKLLVLSENNHKVVQVSEEQPYEDHPDRFDYWVQVVSKEGLEGRCYWEMEWEGTWVAIGVTYKGISRKGTDNDCVMGYNRISWSLHCHDKGYRAYHNFESIVLRVPQDRSRGLAVYLDSDAGILSFYRVSSGRSLTHLHTFYTKFTEPLYPVFRVWGKDSSLKLCRVK
ncbi:hypothetical protein L3Q82_012912 [Scortum barcoo]|uniref:Uncharacterized protein n=1 Tax=Scortum barcoo TaxID=214431 RepID=A0ACB8W110_9TELE|nr:hypothetical protein L3Q82_012912 [Scortum barcoo]